MTIAIFGDSFSDPEKNEPHYFNGETADSWYDILKNKTGEMVLNFSISGVGPYTLFENFYDEFENNHSNFDKIIFILSCKYRLPINLGDPKNGFSYQPFIKEILADSDNDPIQIGENKIYPLEKMKSIEYEIFYTHKIFKEEIFRHNIKNIYFLKTLAHTFRKKIIVFLSFGFNRSNKIHNFIDLEKIYHLKDLNDNFFHLETKPLSEVSLEESVHKIDYDIYKKNFRANHLSWCNHKILSNKILNFFENMKLNDKWQKNILTTWNDDAWENKQLKNYIYE